MEWDSRGISLTDSITLSKTHEHALLSSVLSLGHNSDASALAHVTSSVCLSLTSMCSRSACAKPCAVVRWAAAETLIANVGGELKVERNLSNSSIHSTKRRKRRGGGGSCCLHPSDWLITSQMYPQLNYKLFGNRPAIHPRSSVKVVWAFGCWESALLLLLRSNLFRGEMAQYS